MASALPNSASPNWNIPKNEEPEEEDDSYPRRSSMFPLGRSFSSLGGGDAPLMTNMPRVRSQLFTISTRAVTMTSHSEMSVNYLDCDGVCETLTNSSASSSVDSDIEEIAARMVDVKPLNTESGLSSPTPQLTKVRWEEDDEVKFRTLSRAKRCIHGSIEDLRNVSSRNTGGDRGRRKSAPIPTSRGGMIQAANDLLVDENRRLIQTIQNLKRKLAMTKIATLFTLQAVKSRGKVIKELGSQVMDKERQCAARLILHSLLLNCWRNTKRELDMRMADNADLRKSVDNLSLQVQVLRHVQAGDRQKAQEKADLIRELREEMGVIKEENQMMRREMDKMENELNSLQASDQNLTDENRVLTAEITKMMEIKANLVQSLDWERVRSEQFSKENSSLKESLKQLENEVKDATEQKMHWQERARCSESEAWELQLHLESRTNSIKELAATCETLRTEKIKLIEMKSQLKSSLDRTSLALQTMGVKNDELLETYEQVKAERDAKANTIQEMATTLETTKREFGEIERELMAYKLQNVRRRREWGNALYFIISPMESVRRKLL